MTSFGTKSETIRQAAFVATTVGLSLLGIIVSWRRQLRLEQECERLRRSLSGTSTKRHTPDEGQNISIVTRKGSSEINPRTTIAESQPLMQDGIQVKPVGVIRSIYRLCVGTPRQGLLCPSARGVIELLPLGNSSPYDSVSGLEGFSHIWIVFIFHLNTQSKNASKRIKSKIAPPVLGGKKVGIFATRTPHRFNPVGMTLCKLDRIAMVGKKGIRLHISGLDLVDGTPVLDIKPYVPIYDSLQMIDEETRLPEWVSGGLSMKRPVIITESATSDLKRLLLANPRALEFYGPHTGEVTVESTMSAALSCIHQVLSIDVRSSYQTQKSRGGKFQAERSHRIQETSLSLSASTQDANQTCTQQLDNLLIHYQIEEPSETRRGPSSNSGAEDIVSVMAIELLSNRSA